MEKISSIQSVAEKSSDYFYSKIGPKVRNIILTMGLLGTSLIAEAQHTQQFAKEVPPDVSKALAKEIFKVDSLAKVLMTKAESQHHMSTIVEGKDTTKIYKSSTDPRFAIFTNDYSKLTKHQTIFYSEKKFAANLKLNEDTSTLDKIEYVACGINDYKGPITASPACSAGTGHDFSRSVEDGKELSIIQGTDTANFSLELKALEERIQAEINKLQ